MLKNRGESSVMKELAFKQHSMWIAELLDNSWSSNVSADMSAFEEKQKGMVSYYFMSFFEKM
jgi:hypothetical protein